MTTPLGEYVRARMEDRGWTRIVDLAKAAGVSIETARGVLVRTGRPPSEMTLEKVAAALGADIQQLRRLAGDPEGEPNPFVLPPEANQLDARQRQVVLSMIGALLDASGRAADEVPPTDSDGQVADPKLELRLVGRLRDTNSPSEHNPDSDDTAHKHVSSDGSSNETRRDHGQPR